MNYRKLFLTLSFVLFKLNSAFALNLADALHSSEEHSHEIKELKLTNQSNHLAETKVWSEFMPHLDLTGRHLFSERFQVLDINFGGSTFSMPAIQPYTSLAVNAEMEIFSGFESTHQLQAAQLKREASEHDLKHAEEKLKARIRTLFYQALGSQILVTVANQNIETLEGHLKDINSRVRSGVSTKFDALRTEVQLEDARTEKFGAESNVAITRARLFEAIGLPDDGQSLDGKMPEDFSQYDLNKVTLQNATREDRLAQIKNLEAQTQIARAAKAHWLPKVSLFGTEEWYNNTNHSISESDEKYRSAYALGILFKWNLFDVGASLASQRQAEIAKKIADEKLAQFDQVIPVDIEEAKRRFFYNVTNYKAKQSSIRKAEEAVRLAQGGVRAGTRTNTEALDSVVDLNRAKAAAVKSQVDAIEALGQLELAIGHSL